MKLEDLFSPSEEKEREEHVRVQMTEELQDAYEEMLELAKDLSIKKRKLDVLRSAFWLAVSQDFRESFPPTVVRPDMEIADDGKSIIIYTE